MSQNLERLPIFVMAERICDEVWQEVANWSRYDREVMGGQLIRAADSIGANIAESHGRFHFAGVCQVTCVNGMTIDTKRSPL